MRQIKKNILFIIASLVLFAFHGSSALAHEARIHNSIPPSIIKEMKQHSWRKGCPVPISDLVYLEIPYLNYDGQVKMGELIVHKDVAKEVKEIFKELLHNGFPIKSMKLIDEYEGDDGASMKDNNTSAFNCRYVPGHPGVFSKHSYGRAIDINPLINPFVQGKTVLPEEGKTYLDRDMREKGMIAGDSIIYKAFKKRGWIWGGDWKTLKDYQHFQKVKGSATSVPGKPQVQ